MVARCRRSTHLFCTLSLIFFFDISNDIAFVHGISLLSADLRDFALKLGKHFAVFSPHGSDVAEVLSFLDVLSQSRSLRCVYHIDFPKYLSFHRSSDRIAAGSLDQIGVKYSRLWGDVNDPEVLEKMVSFLKAAAAVTRLKGLTFGNFGGRPLGMYTAVANLEQWQKEFGIDVENIEQDDIIRAGDKADPKEVEKAFNWLTENVGNIAYDGKGLTPEKLRTQIRSYIGLRDIIADRRLDFIGIKAHGDLTDRYCTMDIAEALLNDPYDWNGPKEPTVAATESDMDGALTMQIFKHLTGSPVLFADVRHYDKENDIWFFSNSGTHATFFAGASYDPKENLKNVDLLPETDYYPAGGASVHHFAKEGKVTLARLARKNGKYYLTIVPAEFVNFDREKMLALGSTTTPAWPAAFARLKVPADYFISNFPCNHIHGVYGDCVESLVNVAKILGIPVNIFE